MRKKSLLILFLMLTAAMPSLAQDRLAKGELKRIANTPFIEHPEFQCGFQHILENLDTFNQGSNLADPQRDAVAKTGDIELEIGDVLEFTTVNFRTSGADRISAELRHKTDKTYIFVEQSQWQSGRVVQANIDAFHDAFEVSTPSGSIDPSMGIREIEETHLGLPPDKAGDGYVYILIHDIQDNYNAETNPTFIAGYFNPTDQTNGANSNRKDIIYVDSFPNNPSGQFALLAVAHEYQHLIHNRYDPNEQTWLNEGSSEYAQHITGFGVPTPARYFAAPGTPLTSWSSELADYERTGLFMVYLGDAFGTPFVSRVIQDTGNGPDSISDILTGEGIPLSFDDVFTNFAIANLVNDPSLHPDGYYGYSSFALPILPNINTVHDLYPVDEQNKFLSPYAASYYLFTGVDTTAALHLSSTLTNSVAGNVFEFGETTRVYPIQLNSANQGEASLAAIGHSANFAFLIASSFNNASNYAYSVSSQFEDLTEPDFTLGPRETLSTGSAITIYWETDELSTSVLEYGLTSDYGLTIQNQNFNTTHQFTIANLQPNTTYHYRVCATDQRGNGPACSADFTFTTTAATISSIAGVQQTHSFGYEGRNIVRTSDDVLHILYHEIVGTRRFVYHIQSSDDGDNWSVPNATDNSMFFGGMPSLAVDRFDRLHMAWHAQPDSTDSFSIFYSRSDDMGATWMAAERVSKIFTTGDNLYASVAVDTLGNPHVVWNSVLQSTNIGDVHYNYSVDAGNTWPDDQIIGSSVDHSAFVPTIELNVANKAYVFYSDGVFDNRNRFAYVVTSEDYLNWTEPDPISTSGVLYDGFISFTIDTENNVHAVYSDNFTPGDIRVMYTQLVVSGESTGWTTPTPAAGSVVFGGQTSYPNISVDSRGDLYLVYIDSQSASQTGFAKPLQLISRDERSPALEKVTQGNGDAYLTVFKGEGWLQPTNISSVSTHIEYVEMPRRSKPGIADIMWMKEFSITNNEINFISLDTGASGASTAPLITAVFPEDNAVDVPYFKDVLNIKATFDQRVNPDSLNDRNIIIAAAGGQAIAGEFNYVESQKQMVFAPSENIPASEEITVTVLANVFTSSGLPLDGNGNGQSDGSPADDFVWRFQTQAVDNTPPSFTIGVLQNPVLTRYVDLYVIASEPLTNQPELTLNGTVVPLSLLDTDARIYKGDVRLDNTGTLVLVVNGTDFAQNAGQANKSFSAQLLIADMSGSITSPDNTLHLSVAAGSLNEDTYLTVSKMDGSDTVTGLPGSEKEAFGMIAAYRVGPSATALQRDGVLSLTAPGISAKLLLQFKNETGDWQTLPATQKGSTVTAKISQLGRFRILEADNSVPTQFALHQNYPNPFAAADQLTKLAYELPNQSQVDIVIYNLLGEKVRTLFGGIKEAGFHELSWDGRDHFGTRVASGIYFYQLKTIKSVLTRKMLILH